MDLDFTNGSPVLIVSKRSAGYKLLHEISRKELLHKLATGSDYSFMKEKLISSFHYMELFGLLEHHGESFSLLCKLTARARQLLETLYHDNRQFILYQDGHMEPLD